MWQKYFKFIKLVPGKVVVPGHGTIDFSKDNLPLDLLKTLHENKFPYLEITDEGKKELYGMSIEATEDAPTPKKKKVKKDDVIAS
jgi:hypothetical protein